MPNYGDSPMRRAVGMIVWKMAHRDPITKEIKGLAAAVAEASAHEPEMSEAQLRHAAGWALAARATQERLRAMTAGETLRTVLDETKVEWYADPANWPPDGGEGDGL